MSKVTYDKPSEVVSEESRVIVDEPDHVDVVFTAEAAVETRARLIGEAAKAAGRDRAKK